MCLADLLRQTVVIGFTHPVVHQRSRHVAPVGPVHVGLSSFWPDYNTTRPHQALDMATPAERFRLAPLAKGRVSVPVDSREDHRGQWILRRVGSNGMVSVDNQLFSVTNAYKGELVDVFVDDSLIQVWSKNHLIRTIARAREGRVRKVRADGLHVNDQPKIIRQASAGT